MVTNELSHLEEIVKPVLDLSLTDRLDFLRRDRWVPYTAATEILLLMDDLLAYPKTIRMPCLLVVGDADNGKSSLMVNFSRKRHPPGIDPDGHPVAFATCMEMPDKPDDSRFWSAMLNGLNILHDVGDSAQRKQAQAYKTLQYTRPKMILVDEVHKILQADPRNQKVLLGMLRSLSSFLSVSVVATGIRDAIRALHSDDQVSSRFDVRVLPRWNLNKEYLVFLKGYEALMPFPEPSNLASRELAMKIYPKSGGTIGRTVKVLKQAGEIALRAGKPCIDVTCIEKVKLESLDQYFRQEEEKQNKTSPEPATAPTP